MKVLKCEMYPVSLKLTVLLASHNGAGTLPRVLEGYTQAHAPHCDWEIVVVNNASTDTTNAILEDFQARLPLKFKFEGLPGKNRALNSGLDLVTGTAIILTDDDAVPEAGFLRNWEDAIQKHPDTDVFGGTVDLIFDAPLPEWHQSSKSHFSELYAYRKGMNDGPVEATDIYGPNMAVGPRVVRDGIRFNEDIGPAAGNSAYAMGSETELCRRLSDAGYSLSFVSSPAVSHIVRPHQTTPDFMRQRAYRLGKGAALQQWIAGDIKRTASGKFRTFLRKLRQGIRGMGLKVSTLHPGQRERFEAQWELDFFKGYSDQLSSLRNS